MTVTHNTKKEKTPNRAAIIIQSIVEQETSKLDQHFTLGY